MSTAARRPADRPRPAASRHRVRAALVVALLAAAAACTESREATAPGADGRASTIAAGAGARRGSVDAAPIEEVAAVTGEATAFAAPAAAPAPAPASSAPPGVASSLASAAPAPAVGTTQPGSAPGDAVSLIVRTGDALVEVDSLESAVGAVRRLGARLGGYVADVSIVGGRDQVRSATLQLRLPAARFDEAVAGLAPFGHVERVSVRAEDVSEEYVDGAARLANARRLEARLVELLGRTSARLADVLAVERELARVREEVERIEGRLRWLRARSALSTLAVTVHERAPLVGPAPASAPIAEAVRQAWRNFVALVAGAIALSGALVPLGVVAYGAARLALRWRRRAGARSAESAPGAPAPAAAPGA